MLLFVCSSCICFIKTVTLLEVFTLLLFVLQLCLISPVKAQSPAALSTVQVKYHHVAAHLGWSSVSPWRSKWPFLVHYSLSLSFCASLVFITGSRLGILGILSHRSGWYMKQQVSCHFCFGKLSKSSQGS